MFEEMWLVEILFSFTSTIQLSFLALILAIPVICSLSFYSFYALESSDLQSTVSVLLFF